LDESGGGLTLKRETIIEEIGGGVAVLTMNRPKQRNAFNNRMYDDLRDALSDAQESDRVRVVVITGAPGAFSGGQDLGEMGKPPPADGQPHGFGPFMDRLCGFDKPLLAAVNGVGVGIGLTMLLHCDIVYIAEGARLRAPFVSLGVVPEAASSYLLSALVGHPRAAEVFYTNEWIDAGRAVELGIALRVCKPEELMPAIRAKAAEIAAQPLGALRHTRRLLLASREEQVRAARAREDQTFAHRIGSPENLEAIQAFFDKRAPDFTKIKPG
jgi:enoyl-CoA hydratase/carnithine racemase